eukprot:1903155-Alexandrium_andersonii.AAC.1
METRSGTLAAASQPRPMPWTKMRWCNDLGPQVPSVAQPERSRPWCGALWEAAVRVPEQADAE